MHAQRGHVPADRRRHPLDQRGREGRAPGQRGGVDRGAHRGEAGQALLVHHRREAEPGRTHHDALLTDQLRRTLVGRDRCAAVDPGQVAEPVPARLRQRRGVDRGEDVLHRRDVLRPLDLFRRVAGLDLRRGRRLGLVGVVAAPAAAELADLLLEGQLGQQQVDPLPDRQRGVLPGMPHPLVGPRRVGGRHALSFESTDSQPAKLYENGPTGAMTLARRVPARY